MPLFQAVSIAKYTAERPLSFILVFFIMFSSWGCASTKRSVTVDDHQALRNEIRQDAKSKIGSGYKYAAKGPHRFDCSGLVYYTFHQHGIEVPPSSRHLSRLAKGIKIEEAQPGDLIFFKRQGRIFHVSIITDNRKNELWVVHSTTSRGVVEQDILASPYWKNKINKVISLADIIP